MNLRPLKPTRPEQNSKNSTRWNYRQNSQDFVGWVNKLGIERTFLGRIAHYIDSKLQIKRFSFIFLFSLILSFLIAWNLEITEDGYKEGDVARTTMKSPFNFELLDQEQTQKNKSNAELSVPATYDYDVSLYDVLGQRLHQAFQRARQHANSLDIQSDFESELGGIAVAAETFRWLVKKNFSASLENEIIQNLGRWSNQKILDDAKIFKSGAHSRITIEVIERGTKSEEFAIDPVGILDVAEIRKRLTVSRQLTPQMAQFLRTLVLPNLTLNKVETELRRHQASENVNQVWVTIKKGQAFIQEGDVLKSLHIAYIENLSRMKATRHQDFVALMTAAFFTILIICFGGFLSRFTSRVKVTTKDSVAMGSIVLLILACSKFIIFVTNSAFVDHFHSIPVTFYSYSLPVSAGAMMVGLLIPFGEVVWLFSIFLAIVMGLLIDRNFTFMIVTFTSSIVAARGVYGCKKREDLYVAGIKTGLINAGLILCVTLMDRQSSGVIKHELIWNVPAGFMSGILASFVTLTLIPLWESLFIYTTDVKLLELSNLNHPLLKEMIVKAPGTYHHSLVVGSMCEAAAEAIGANPLLAKVCAYYHDIGKTNYAMYFIENQRPGENRHDHISPSMSKTVLIAHVKDGVELGLKYKLGKPIIDVIEQHHGTTLMSFFYYRAKEHEDTKMHEVKEGEFRYPGPKPEFREAALCMLGDSIEAAARTLDEPTPARLQSIVHNIVQKKFLDGQLDNCNLTLRDLALIEESFSKILMGIYHHRIDYPTSYTKAATTRHGQQTVS